MYVLYVLYHSSHRDRVLPRLRPDRARSKVSTSVRGGPRYKGA
jgi:hypothetical protein